MLRNLGFVARTFDVLSPETVRLSLTRFHLRLNCQRRFQRERSESVDEQLADAGIKSICEGPALLQGLVICGRVWGNRLTPEYACKHEYVQRVQPICQMTRGKWW
jgi:predicted alpha/beta-hydrolase family hydrolase